MEGNDVGEERGIMKGDEIIKPAEYKFLIQMMRDICKEYGDNDWDDNLHIVDIVHKHLHKHLPERKRRKK